MVYKIDSIRSLSYFKGRDRLSCGYSAKVSLKERITNILAPNYILSFEKLLREVEYLTNCKSGLLCSGILLYNRLRLRKMQVKLGFSIPLNVFGPGLSIPHYGTIVVNPSTKVGENCRLHVGVNIGANGGKDKAPKIGNNVYIGPGAIIFGDVEIADNVSIGANATVNKSCLEANVVLAGTPAKIVKRNVPAWNEK